MNCSAIQRRLADAPAGRPPAECRPHLEACAACREFARRDVAVRRLIALARYASPRPGLEDRLAYRVEQDLAAAAAPAGILAWLTPAVLARAAAVAVILVGAARLYFASRPGTATDRLASAPVPASISPRLPLTVEPPAVVSEPTLLALPAPEPPPERSPFLLPISPGGIQYGPSYSTPADFEY